MQHNSRKKRNSNERKVQHQPVPEPSAAASGTETEHATPNLQPSSTRTPFYDDTTHVAYGWQQMATLPDFQGLHTLVGGTQSDPPLSPENRSQTWAGNGHQRDGAQYEPSGFNPHPRRGQGPRRPPSLTRIQRQGEHRGRQRGAFKPFVDSPLATPDVTSTEGIYKGMLLAPPVLPPTDVNQKLRIHKTKNSVRTSSELTDGLQKPEPQRRAQRLMVDELEKSQHTVRKTERMSMMVEEPAPLRIRKKVTNIGVTGISRAERQQNDSMQQSVVTAKIESNPRASGVNRGPDVVSIWGSEGVKATVCESSELEDEELDSLTVAITEWQTSESGEKRTHEFKHRSAIPQPLDLAAIRIAKEQRRKLDRSEADSNNDLGRDDRCSSCAAKTVSVQSLATSMSSDFEPLDMPGGNEVEHNGPRRKWYKGFRCLE